MVELPRWDAARGDEQRCIDSIDSWALRLRDSGVVSLFVSDSGIESLQGQRLLDALDDFAATHWDFRGGRERNLATRPDLSPRQTAAIDQIAAELGLDGTPPPRRSRYDAVLMTGGMVRAGIVKPRYLKELFDGGLEAREGTFLGGFRPFAGDELAVAPALGVQGTDEFSAMIAGMRQAFSLADPDSSVGASAPSESDAPLPDSEYARWRIDTWQLHGTLLRVMAAPSSEPLHRRANTVDTYRFWASRAKDIRSVLVITTPIYVPYQGAGAIEILGIEYGLSVETVAVSAGASDLGEFSQPFLPMHRAQEMRSAIHALKRLRFRVSTRATTSDASEGTSV